ncbi:MULTISPECIES: hypothetical protein [unclassified Synechococcus]|uniref:hypothetical protein n=1 Tax=unclassified Synechococcus TaxID=2626047 RepID=UPI0039C349F9
MTGHNDRCCGSPVLDEEDEQDQYPQAQEYGADASARVGGTESLHGLNPFITLSCFLFSTGPAAESLAAPQSRGMNPLAFQSN